MGTMETSNYQIISRKYRPQRFQEIAGQEAIVSTLKNALQLGRVANAYLFCGSRGTGKTTIARVFAKALNCSHLTDDFEPCNHCPSCAEIASGRSLDVLEIDGASNRGIDDIRQINETVGYSPSSGKYKIYIIDEVHMLTKEAFNALLKTLEEPPAKVKFFFATTEPHKVLSTITSRCQRFDLSRISSDAIQKKLKAVAQDSKIQVEERVFELIASLSEGSLRDAESLFDQLICFSQGDITYEKAIATLKITSQQLLFDLDRAIHAENYSFAFELAHSLFSSGKEIAPFLDDLLEHFRQLLQLKLHTSGNESYASSAALYTKEQCLDILELLLQWQQQLSKMTFKQVHLEMLLVQLIRSHNRLSLNGLVKRLLDLEKTFSAPAVQEKKEVIKTESTPLPKSEIVETAPPKVVEIKSVQPIQEVADAKTKSRHETLMRFAAVELEGSIKK